MIYSASDFAKKILLEHWDYSLPVESIVIANKLGIRVIGTDNIQVSGYFDATTSTIYVKNYEPETRQRFTIAHEIGHAVLGHGSSLREISQQFNQKDYQINEFQAKEIKNRKVNYVV